MRLKSIKLAGFKSFVDPVTVNFPSNMSAVVGPNGCGKSNIIDAVRWVMGESSARQLRGESMADVIFNGSTARQPVGQAAIELVFDNSDKTLTGEYAAFNEISVRRKVSRDGESSYFLNSAKCRRRDITDIFLGTGLGPRSYAIIEQGMISNLIEAKPEELRVYIEEAAGISRYKERRRDTENRIRRTRENLERLTDIRNELQRQLQHLNRQAKTAERYRKLKQQERDNTALLRAVQWQALAAQGETAAAQAAAEQVKLEAAQADKVNAETAIEQQRLKLREQSDKFNDVQSRFYGLGAEIARDEQRINSIQERELQLNRDLEQAQNALAEAQQHISTDSDTLVSARAELNVLEPQLASAEAQEAAAVEALEQAQQTMQNWQQQWDEFNNAAAAAQQQAEVEQSRIQYIEQALQRLSERKATLQQEQQQLATEAPVGNINQLAAQLQATTTQLEQHNNIIENLVEAIQQTRAELGETGQQQSQTNSHLQQQQGRLSALEALQQEATSQGDTAELWLSEQQLATAKRLADSLNVTAGWEKAVETVLGQLLQSVTVDNIDHYLNQPEPPAAGVCLLQPATASTEPPAANSLAHKLQGSDASGQLAQVLCADTVTEALALRSTLQPGQSVITPEGVWLGPNWLRMQHEGDAETSVLRRQNDINELQTSIDTTTAQIATLEQRKTALTDQLLQQESEQQAAQTTVQQLNQQLTAQTSDHSAMRVRQEQVLARLQQLETEQAETARQHQSERDNLATHRQRLETALERMAEQTAQREQLLLQRDNCRSQLEAARNTASQQKDNLMALSIRHQSLKTQLESVQQTNQRLVQQLGTLEQRTATLTEQLAGNSNPLPALQTGLEANLQARLEVEQALAAARDQISQTETDIRSSETRRNQAEAAAQEIRSSLEAARLDLQTVRVQQNTLKQQLLESGHTAEDLLAATETIPTESELKTRLEQLHNSISRLGAINLAAIDEYEQQSERKVYLDAQNEDLLAALATLENAIRKIDRETRSRFKATFDEVNAGIGELFPQVFGGGQAYLELTGDDLLNTGIAIMARPPGKKNTTIHLLSGGEKALTAIALVFAIFRLNPAPFCMLDEVDAPLDDANVGRYVRLLKAMSSTVQFIYITHNKITMEFADHLLGVTMHEAGVSRLVTVDIEKAAELAEV